MRAQSAQKCPVVPWCVPKIVKRLPKYQEVSRGAHWCPNSTIFITNSFWDTRCDICAIYQYESSESHKSTSNDSESRNAHWVRVWETQHLRFYCLDTGQLTERCSFIASGLFSRPPEGDNRTTARLNCDAVGHDAGLEVDGGGIWGPIACNCVRSWGQGVPGRHSVDAKGSGGSLTR